MDETHFGSWQRITTDRYWKQLQSRPARFLPGLARLLRFKSVFEERLMMPNMTTAKTYTVSGWNRAEQHELLVDELCDLYMEMKKVAWNLAEEGHAQSKRADRDLRNVAEIIDKLQAWEKANL